MKISRATVSQSSPSRKMPTRIPFFTRSYAFAPRFWLTNVVSAIVKQVTGRKPKPLDAAVRAAAAMAAAPNWLMLLCTTTFPMEMMLFWQTGGQAVLQNFEERAPVKADFPQADAVRAFASHQAEQAKCSCSPTGKWPSPRRRSTRPCGTRRQRAGRARR